MTWRTLKLWQDKSGLSIVPLEEARVELANWICFYELQRHM